MDNRVESTTEYVTQSAFEGLQAQINSRFEDIQAQISDAINKTNAAVQAAKSSNLQAAKDMVSERLESERQQRRDEIESLRQELKEIGRDQKKSLAEIDGKLDVAMQGIAGINGAMKGITDSFDLRDKKVDEVTKRLDGRIDEQSVNVASLRTDADFLMSAQDEAKSHIRQLTTTIHGNPDNKDDAPSLFGMLGGLKSDMAKGFAKIAENHEGLKISIEHNALAISAIRMERQREKEMWEQRLSGVKKFTAWVQKLFSTALGRVLLVTLIGGVSVLIFPELRETVVSGLQSMFELLFATTGG